MAIKNSNLEDRRSAPRFEVSFKGTITSSTQRISSIEITNISTSGLQLAIAQSEIPDLIPNDSQANSLSPIQIELSCCLPNTATTIRIRCGIVYVKRIAIEACQIGCRFEHFHEQSGQLLESYIKHCSSSSSRTG